MGNAKRLVKRMSHVWEGLSLHKEELFVEVLAT